MNNRTHAVLAVILASVIACDGSNENPGGSGLIEADEVLVSAETPGRVTEMRATEGSAVSVGDTLAVIDPSRLELQIASLEAVRRVTAEKLKAARIQARQAEDRESFAKSELDRIDRLLRAGTSSQQKYDQLQFEHSQASLASQSAGAQVTATDAEIDRIDAEIDLLKRHLEDCYPLAPMAGVVTEKYVEAGELLTTGKSIARIARLDTVWVKVYLPAGDFANVRLGNRAAVSTESGGRSYEGVVVRTADEAEFTPKNIQTAESRAGLVYGVKVRIPNPDGYLKIGMPVYVTLEPQ